MTGSIVELRQYALHPGRRDALIELFEREFIESQEAQGMRILGVFRDLDNPDSFVWIRSFENMAQRRQALEAFYSGPVWRAHREAANATMIDTDNVLLLRPLTAIGALPSERPAPGARDIPGSIFVATIYSLPLGRETDFAAAFESRQTSAPARAGVELVGTFATEHSENTFPALPVRERENVFVTLHRFDPSAHQAHDRASAEILMQDLRSRLIAPPQTLRLQPTARSLLR